MKSDGSMKRNLKTCIWALSAGTIVAFFFSANFLSWATRFNPGGTILFFSPLVCGFLLGILTWEEEVTHTVFATILMTITTTVIVAMTLISPSLFGVAKLIDYYYLFVAQNVILSVVMVLPISLLGAISGKALTGSAMFSPELKADRDRLRLEASEWYKMLEQYIEAKKSTPPPIDHEMDKKLTKPGEKK